MLERLRTAGDDVPVCVLSARDEVDDRVRGLQAGADDYVVKPFAIEEVTARLHALLRRRPALPDAAVTVGDVEIDPRSHAATRAGRDLGLVRGREFDLLHLFMRRSGEVVDRSQLHEEVWGFIVRSGHERRRRLRRLSAPQARGRRRVARAAHRARRRVHPAPLRV